MLVGPPHSQREREREGGGREGRRTEDRRQRRAKRRKRERSEGWARGKQSCGLLGASKEKKKGGERGGKGGSLVCSLSAIA